MIRKEFIGKQAKIKYNGKEFDGVIVDETKNLICLRTDKGVKKILKRNATLSIGGHQISGKDIMRRPEDRIK